MAQSRYINWVVWGPIDLIYDAILCCTWLQIQSDNKIAKESSDIPTIEEKTKRNLAWDQIGMSQNISIAEN